MNRALIAAMAAATMMSGVSARDDTPAHTAVARALPLLQASAQTWIERRPCASCHHQGLGTTAVVLARERGFTIDPTRLAAQIDRLAADSRESGLLGAPHGINVQISLSYLLDGLGAAGAPADGVTDARVHVIAGRQQPDGRWRSQSHRPPLEDSDFTATAVAVRAIQLYAPPDRRAEMSARVARARAWLTGAVPRTTEERTMQLFGLKWTDAPRAAIARAAAALIAEQRPDGGWAQIPSLGSDAYATGQALVALNQAAGTAPRDASFAKGVHLLLTSQQADGSWHVATRRKFPGLPYFESGFPYGKDQFISYAATAWATMALILADRGDPSPVLTSVATVARATSARAAADGVTPLIERAAFGTVDQVAQLLDAGADVNVASKAGVTALMVSVRDPAIARLLIARGADVNARSAEGFTPLMLAAGYDGANDVLGFLLSRGAADTTARNGTTPLIDAVIGGGIEKVQRLLAAGSHVNVSDRQTLTPLFIAADQGDASMVRALAAAGADVNAAAPGVFGWTPLAAAASDGYTEVVRALLAAGANVNARDDEGRSVLDLAKLVDNGPATRDVIDALVRAGAR